MNQIDARIGQLGSGKFYAYANGYNAEPTIGTLEEVEVALGLKAAQPKPTATKAKPAARQYEVTVTPKFSDWRSGQYTTIITAKDRASAISKARREYRDNSDRNDDGSFANGTAAITAKLAN